MFQDLRFSRESFIGSVWWHRPWQKVDRRCRQRPQHWNEHVTAYRDATQCEIHRMRASNPSAHAKRVYSAQHECRYAPHSSAAIRNDHVPPRVARVSRAS